MSDSAETSAEMVADEDNGAGLGSDEPLESSRSPVELVTVHSEAVASDSETSADTLSTQKDRVVESSLSADLAVSSVMTEKSLQSTVEQPASEDSSTTVVLATENTIYLAPSASPCQSQCGDVTISQSTLLSERHDANNTKSDESSAGQLNQFVSALDGLLVALLDAASDVQDEVRASISTAIFTLGRSRPYRVLLTVFNYLNNDRPKGYTQRICVLQAVEELCREVGAGSALSDHQVMELAPLIVSEMVKSDKIIPQIQLPCSEALVGLGHSHCFQVMDSLTFKFETSRLPHFYVLQTIGSLAVANVYTMVPFIKGLLGPIQPMLRTLKNDDLKWAFAFVLARFCECINDYLVNIDKAPDPLVKKEFYSSEISVAFDVLFNSWLSTKDIKLRLQVCEALGHMAHIMDTSRLAELLPRLLPALVALYRGRHAEPFPVTCALAHILEASLSTGRHTLEPHLDTLLQALFQQVCTMVDYSMPLTVKNHYEVLRCCDILCKCSPDPVVNFHLSRLAHSSDRVRSACLLVLKHLINASEFELASKMADIQTALRSLLYDSSIKVRKSVTQVIVALAHRGYLIPSDSAVFVEFIVRQCCLPGDSSSAGDGHSSFSLPATAASLPSAIDCDTSSASLRAMCEHVLHLLSTTVDQVYALLWPRLLGYLRPEFAPARQLLLRCCAQLAWRARTTAEAGAGAGGARELPGPAAASGSPPPAPRLAEAAVFGEDYAGVATGAAGAASSEATGPPDRATGHTWQPASLTAQLLVWTAAGQCGDSCKYSLQLLAGLVEQLNPALKQLWSQQIPLLQQTLDKCNDPDNMCVWQQSVLDFISESMLCAKNAEWTNHVAAAIGRMLVTSQPAPISVDSGRERALLMRCLAVCVCHQTEQQSVFQSLDTVFAATQHQLAVERQGCAKAFGQIASAHLDTVLAKLDQITRAELTKKPTGLLGLMKDIKGEAAQERMRATVVLCYGQVMLMAPRALLSDRLQVPVYRDLKVLITHCKTDEVRSALVTTCGQLASALLPLSPPSPRHPRRHHHDGDGEATACDAPFDGRDCLLQFVLSCVGHHRHQQQQQPPDLAALLNIVTSIDALVSLSPGVLADQRATVLNTVLDAVLPIHAPIPEDGPSTDNYEQYQKLLSALYTLLRTLLAGEFVVCAVDDTVLALLPWMTSQHSHEREHSVAALQCTLKVCLARVTGAERSRMATFGLGGQLLASLIPRCVDPQLTIRPPALACVSIVLSVMTVCDGGRSGDDGLIEMQSKLLECDELTIGTHLAPMAQLLSERVCAAQVSGYLDSLLLAVGDRHPSSSLAAAVALHRLLQRRGAECYQRVPEIMHGLYGVLSRLSLSEAARHELLSAVGTLACHHHSTVCSVLLSYPLPYDDHVLSCWRAAAAAGDSCLAAALLSQLVELIVCAAPYDDQQHDRPGARGADSPPPSLTAPLRIASLQPLAAVSAMHCLFGAPETASVCSSQRADLFVRLLVTQAAYVSVCPPVQQAPPCRAAGVSAATHCPAQAAHEFVPNRSAYKLSPFRMATDALLAFLRRIELAALADDMATVSDARVEDDTQYADLVLTYTRLCVRHCPRLVTEVTPILSNHLSSMYDSQRTAAAAFYAELVSHRALSNVSLTESVLNSLLSRLVDSSPVVRRVCLLGLGNMTALYTVPVADVDFSHVLSQLGATVMSALLAGLDDHTDPAESIPLQAIVSLGRLLPVTSTGHVQHTLIPITLRIRVYFESSNVDLRAGAFRLFGVCHSGCGTGDSGAGSNSGGDSGAGGMSSLLAQYTEQVHNNLIALLLHVNDPAPAVVSACKSTLLRIAPLLVAPSAGEVFQSHLSTPEAPQYTNFVDELAKSMVKELDSNLGLYAMTLLTHLRSQWSEIKSASALFLALLMSNMCARQRKMVKIQPVCSGLRQLLADPDWNVRVQAARAISFLHDF